MAVRAAAADLVNEDSELLSLPAGHSGIGDGLPDDAAAQADAAPTSIAAVAIAADAAQGTISAAGVVDGTSGSQRRAVDPVPVADAPIITIEGVRHFPPVSVIEQTEYSNPDAQRGGGAIARHPDGGFMLAWAEYNGASDFDIFVQRYDNDGHAMGGRHLVNTQPSDGVELRPDIAALSDGSFAVVWQVQHDGQLHEHFTFGQRIDADGGQIGSVFHPISVLDNSNEEPRVVALRDGGFVVTRTDTVINQGLMARVYDANGDAIGGVQILARARDTGLGHFAVSALADGGFLVANHYTSGGVRVQRFDATGAANGAEVIVTPDPPSNPSPGNEFAIVALAGGGFAVAYTENGSQVGESSNLRYWVYDAQGHYVASESIERPGQRQHFQLHTPSMVALDDGGFVLTFGSYNGRFALTHDVIGIRFGADGLAMDRSSQFAAPITGSFNIGTTPGTDNYRVEFPEIIALDGDRIAVVWQQDPDPQGAGSTTNNAFIRVLDLGSGLADGVQGQPFPISINVTLTDTDGSETIAAIQLLGLPEDFSLSAGTRNLDGSWSLAVADLAGLQIIPSADFTGTLNLTVRATSQETENGDQATTEQSFDITFSGTNAPPTGIGLSSTDITENAEAGTVVGRLSASDPNLGDQHTFTLTGGALDLFEIVGNELRVRAGADLDFETAASHSVTVLVTDAQGQSFEDTFAIRVLDVNERPGAVRLLNAATSISENADTSARIRVATIAIADDALGTNTLTLAGADADRFEIIGRDLFLRAGTDLDFDTQSRFVVLVELDDASVGGTPDAVVQYTLLLTDFGLTVASDGATILGTDVDDLLTGGAGNNTLLGLGGNDVLEGLGGVDVVDGGFGLDTVSYRSSGDGVAVDLQSRTSWDGTSMDFLVSIENAVGSGGSDTLYGDDGANIFEGLAGVDVIDGRGGSDTVSYRTSATGVVVDLSLQTGWDGVAMDFLASIENVQGSTLTDVLMGDGSDNILEGLAGVDVLRGDGGNDTASYASATTGVSVDLNLEHSWDGASMDFLNSIENAIGSAHGDVLWGSLGDNVLEGLGGDDVMVGHGGNDRFQFRSAGTGTDYITDFDADAAGGQDLIDLGGRGYSAASLGQDIIVTSIEGGVSSMVGIGADVIILRGVASSAIDAADFVF